MKSSRLENEIAYGETQVKFLQDEIENEIRYQKRIRKEKKENTRNFNKYFNIIWALSFFVCGAWSILATLLQSSKNSHMGENGEWVALSEGDYTDATAGLVWLFVLPFVIFSVIGIIKYAPKLINYFKQLRGTNDPRSVGYKTYDEMMAISEGRMKYLDKELTETIVKLEADKIDLEEVRRIGEGVDETISIEELYDIKKEIAEQKESGELLLEEAPQKDISVTASRKEALERAERTGRKN